MTRTMPFRGLGVAMVTPFRADGSLDEPRLRALVDRLIEAGVDALLPAGSTGEGATLTHEEHRRVMDIVLEQANGRVPVIPGAGSNATHEAVDLAQHARRAGATAVLSVTPYYNKPEPEGLLRHYATIAEKADIPIILYNVPSRTGRNYSSETILRIAEQVPLLVGVKESSGNITQALEILASRPAGFAVYAGDDIFAVPTILMGGDGVISVIGNQLPEWTAKMVRAALEGDIPTARTWHFRLQTLMQANFLETNPAPVKCTLAMMGLIEESLRLPLVPVSERTRERLRQILAEMGILS
ncbi:MAG: 4-hydroxy-tetrahydrodipicolinate synthase [Fimbriimonadales bacterium]|nr:4-hydroxy-tetrahydrodipicolinate synthase [Fimbriimonadales bacterium]CUU36654.1 dihydrodipicolinate synthase [Armatimonadetes bacterium DC]